MADRIGDNLDKGFATANSHIFPFPPTTQADKAHAQTSTTDLGQYTAPIDRKTFRQWMGINPVYDRPSATPPYFAPIPRRTRNWTPFRLFSKSAEADGLYGEICFDEDVARWRYHLYNIFVNFSLVAQLALSAVVVALSAMNGRYHIAVTAIGAVNGVIAGILSLIKGQGLPRRLMEFRNSLRRVREKIERVDRQLSVNFTADQAPFVLWADIKEIFDMYEDARQTNDLNHPDNWNSDAGEAKKLLGQTRGALSSLGK